MIIDLCSFSNLVQGKDLTETINFAFIILFWCFCFLNTESDNKLKEIKGLENCKRLTKLSIAHNKIDKIQGLDNLPIQQLDIVSLHSEKCNNKNSWQFHDVNNFCCKGRINFIKPYHGWMWFCDTGISTQQYDCLFFCVWCIQMQKYAIEVRTFNLIHYVDGKIPIFQGQSIPCPPLYCAYLFAELCNLFSPWHEIFAKKCNTTSA